MNNLAPATPFVLGLAAIEQGQDRIAKGEPAEDVYASEANAFFKGMLQQSVYNNVNEINRATGRLLDEKPPVGADGAVDQESVQSALKRYFRRLAAGRSIPNELREIKRTGKFFGIPIAKEDRTIFEAKTIGEEIRSGIPQFKGFPAVDTGIRKRLDFTGNIAQRSRRVSLQEIIEGGRKPKADNVIDELTRLKLFPADAPPSKAVPTGSKVVPSFKTRLTANEQDTFKKIVGPIMMGALRNYVGSDVYAKQSDVVRRKNMQRIIAFARRVGGTKAGFDAFRRQLKSKEGRKQLDFDTFQGFANFFDSSQ
jgi:hypothetical protein